MTRSPVLARSPMNVTKVSGRNDPAGANAAARRSSSLVCFVV